jgi:hypothetical protein
VGKNKGIKFCNYLAVKYVYVIYTVVFVILFEQLLIMNPQIALLQLNGLPDNVI